MYSCTSLWCHPTIFSVVFRQVAHLPPFLALPFSPIADPSFGRCGQIISVSVALSDRPRCGVFLLSFSDSFVANSIFPAHSQYPPITPHLECRELSRISVPLWWSMSQLHRADEKIRRILEGQSWFSQSARCYSTMSSTSHSLACQVNSSVYFCAAVIVFFVTRLPRWNSITVG